MAVRRVFRGFRTEWLLFLAFAGPNLILFAVFTYWPIVYSIYLSAMDWSLLPGGNRFVGMANYQRLFSDSVFGRVVINTLFYALTVVVIAQVVAFLLATMLNRPLRGRSFFRTVAFLPHVTTTAAAALVWVLLLHPRFGPLSWVYDQLGVEGVNWLESGILALAAITVVGIWKEIGFASVFFLAGLQHLPKDCYEAARIDGGSPLTVLRHVTVPLMSPIILFLSISGFIAAIKAFDVVAMMTEGGPVYPQSATYVYHLYTVAFRQFEIGYAAAMAVIFFLVTLGLTLFQFAVARRWVHYEGD